MKSKQLAETDTTIVFDLQQVYHIPVDLLVISSFASFIAFDGPVIQQHNLPAGRTCNTLYFHWNHFLECVSPTQKGTVNICCEGYGRTSSLAFLTGNDVWSAGAIDYLSVTTDSSCLHCNPCGTV